MRSACRPQPGRRVADAVVVAVSRAAGHRFSKENQPVIRLAPRLGVDGDAHSGRTVKRRSRVRRDLRRLFSGALACLDG